MDVIARNTVPLIVPDITQLIKGIISGINSKYFIFSLLSRGGGKIVYDENEFLFK